ncbi:beta-microseminoprotein-like [Anomaloglossus baeobatrachus]|uniref:beta-microseminoprotein-like n=1 Tax=Anomaloglossus baeobatrachus TaxID=238106 RepID=UPI003F50A3E8
MKSFLVIALLGAGIFVGVCNAYCFEQLPEANIDGGDPEGCIHEGEVHKLGSSWRLNCVDCDCSEDGSMRCCSTSGRPVGYNKVKCEVIFDEETCIHRVVRKDNPNKTCKHAMVG